MAKVKSIVQTPQFKKAAKKLKANQKSDLDQAVKVLIKAPDLGDRKKGDLSFMRVYKFKMNNQLTLLGNCFNETSERLELLALGSHENFYRDLKRD